MLSGFLTPAPLFVLVGLSLVLKSNNSGAAGTHPLIHAHTYTYIRYSTSEAESFFLFSFACQ